MKLLPVFKIDNTPTDGFEELGDFLEQIVIDYAVQALSVIVNNPPEILDVMFLAL